MASSTQPVSGGFFREFLDNLWYRFQRDPFALSAAVALLLLYLAIALAGFLAPYDKYWFDRKLSEVDPTPVYTLTMDTHELTWPYVLASKKSFNRETYTAESTLIRDRVYPLKFFVKGAPYKLFGMIPADIHLFGVDAPARINLLGTDTNGRDVFSRLLYGGQISLTIGFISLFVSLPIALLYGGISGFLGGRADNWMMRFSEVIMSIPSFYLLITLATVLPAETTSSERFAMVVIILALIGWAGQARVIRGMVLSIRNQEFIEASEAMGQRLIPILVKHVLPQTASYVIVALTVAVPGYILAESGLSFIGLGIQQPDASWGNMLKEAQEISKLIYQPWLLMPGALIFVAVLAFNILGDAVRDILDPKSRQST